MQIRGNYTIFISDLHLQEAEPEKTERFLQFLQKEALHADVVYILGDFFEAWIGDDNLSKFNQAIITALKKFSKNNIPLYFMRGNRDFLISKKFAKAAGCQLIEDPFKINLYGTPTLLTHGDILCTKDKKHILFRKCAHNPKYNWLFLILPLKLRKFIANCIRKKSIINKTKKSAEIKQIISEAVINLMQQYGVKQLIHGHIHKEQIKEISLGKTQGKILSLGSWDETNKPLIYYKENK